MSEGKPKIGAHGKVFRDPVHGLIRIEPEDAFLLELIDTPDMLRHRHREDSTAADLLDAQEQTVKAAALLHDIGPAPFSSMMDSAAKNWVANKEQTT
jgi:HD superfamily phosphohydrolase